MDQPTLRERVQTDPTFSERYQLDEVVGAGGMGEVWRGIQRTLRRPVAIKFMSAALAQDAACRERFFREAEAASGLVHTHVVAVFDFGVAADVPYLVTELVEGDTLALLLEAGPLAQDVGRAIMQQVLEGLEVIHERGIVHRDLKPANILIRPGERVCAKILDFGVAKQLRPTGAAQTGAGLVVGTPAYMAPEQIVGDPVSAASDLYSATVVFHQMVTGVHPFAAGTAMEVLQLHLHREPQLSADLPPQLAGVFARALSKDPRQRYQSAREYLTALAVVPAAAPAKAIASPLTAGAGTLPSLGAVARPRGTRRVEPLPQTRRRPVAVLAAVAGVLLALVGMLRAREVPWLGADAPPDVSAIGPLLSAGDAVAATKALFVAIGEHPRPMSLAELAADPRAQNLDSAFLGALELWMQRPVVAPEADDGAAPEALRGTDWLPRFARMLARGEYDRAHRSLRLFKYGDLYDGTKLVEPTPDAVAIPELSALNFFRGVLILRTAVRAQEVALGVLFLQTIAAAHPRHPIGRWTATLVGAVEARLFGASLLDSEVDRAARAAASGPSPARYPRIAELIAGTRAFLEDAVLATDKPRVSPVELRRVMLQAQLILAGCDEWRAGDLPWRLPLESLRKRVPAEAMPLPSGGTITLDTPIPADALVRLARRLGVPSTALIQLVERDVTSTPSQQGPSRK